jgi:D-alanyl-D-alanine carboxypeptidase
MLRTNHIASNRVTARHGAVRTAARTGLLALVALVSALPAYAAARHATMVIDANTGETLHAEQADEPRFPASLTKMMTIYMVFEMIEAGRLTPTTKLKVSQEAAAAQPTKLDLEPGEQIAVMDAVKSLITKSANDMAIVLAEAIGGSEAQFAVLMTEKARALGMSRTTFRNASGLPDSGQVTTARDMLTLALRLQDDFPKYYPMFALRSFTYNGSSMRNHNTMLGSFEGIDGIKTGYTRMSGFNLVTSVRRGDKHLVGAVFGGATAGTRNNTMRMILTRALLKASTKKTRKPAPVLVARAKPPAAVAAQTVIATPARPKQQAVVVAQAAPVTLPPQIVPPAALPPVRRQVAAAPPEPQAPGADAAPTAVAAPAFEIARVRPVMVAPRVRPQAPVVEATAPDPAPAFASVSKSIAPAEVSPVRQALTPAQPTQPAPTPLYASAATGLQRGAPPSTLQAQAQSISRNDPSAAPMARAPQQIAFAQAGIAPQTPPSRLRGPEVPGPAAPAAVTGGFQIQIGAYNTAVEAQRVLRDTQTRASALLAAAQPVTAPVQKENRLLYRARFAGFDAKTAANTCIELRRSAIDCFVMKAE